MTDDRNPYPKLHSSSQKALFEAREALLSVSDEDEVSGLIDAVGTLAKANLRATQSSRDSIQSDRVEIQTPVGFGVKGKAWQLVGVSVTLAVLALAILLAWHHVQR
jgi:hypothetical protein